MKLIRIRIGADHFANLDPDPTETKKLTTTKHYSSVRKHL